MTKELEMSFNQLKTDIQHLEKAFSSKKISQSVYEIKNEKFEVRRKEFEIKLKQVKNMATVFFEKHNHKV